MNMEEVNFSDRDWDKDMSMEDLYRLLKYYKEKARKAEDDARRRKIIAWKDFIILCLSALLCDT